MCGITEQWIVTEKEGYEKSGEKHSIFFPVELEVSYETASSLKESTLYLIAFRRAADTEEMDKVAQWEYEEEKWENHKQKCKNSH